MRYKHKPTKYNVYRKSLVVCLYYTIKSIMFRSSKNHFQGIKKHVGVYGIIQTITDFPYKQYIFLVESLNVGVTNAWTYMHHKTQLMFLSLHTRRPVVWFLKNIIYNYVYKKSMPWLRQLVAGLSPRRPGLDPGSVHVGFVVDKVVLGQVFFPSTSVFPCQFQSTGAPLLGKTKKTNHLYHKVAQYASRLGGVRSICCGALLQKKLQL
jgi:hypothetical protein